MGLDMYLERTPRYKGATPHDVSIIENYFDWIREKNNGNEYANCTFKKWCGCELSDLPDSETIEFYRPFYKPTYSEWDKNKEHPWYRIAEEVGYWRKANQIHNWFVENIQDGIDDCDIHSEVTKEDLKELLDVCQKVYDSCAMIVDPDNRWIIAEPSVAKEFLPTTSGFFFGDTDYNEWYVDEIINTINIIQNVLETTDFEKQMIYYVSSW